MHIARIAPLWLLVPPEGYAGVERLVSNLAEGLESQQGSVIKLLI
jgi:hypothetical protein